MMNLKLKGAILPIIGILAIAWGCQKEIILKTPVNETVAAIDSAQKVSNESDTTHTSDVKKDSTQTSGTTYKHIIQVKNPGNDNDIQPAIQEAMNKAVDGDLVVLPAGKFSFTGSITSTKLISLKGAGRDSTILYRPEYISDADLKYQFFFKWEINRDSSSHIIISDLVLKSKIPADSIEGYNLNGSMAEDYGIIIIKAKDFIVTQCRFENFGYAAILIQHKNLVVGGLIFKNVFYHNYKGADGNGLGYGIAVFGEDNQWNSYPNFGSSNFIFIEDNYFERQRHDIAGGGSGLYVCRYNTFKNHVLNAAAIDMHEARGKNSNYYSTRAVEIYNNTFSNDVYKDNSPVSDIPPYHTGGGNALAGAPIGIRGGEVLIHDNYIAYYKQIIFLYAIYHSETGDQNLYPLSTQIGYKSGITYGTKDSIADAPHDEGDAFIWSNTLKPYGPAKTPYNGPILYNGNTTMLQENRDYHFIAKPGYTPFQYPHPLRKGIGI